VKIKIIYYVHGTLSNKNIDCSIAGLKRSLQFLSQKSLFHTGVWSPPDLVLCNSGFDGGYSEDGILDCVKELCGEHLGDISSVTMPPSKSVAVDIQRQIDQIDGADWYLCLKADFVIPELFLTHMYEYAEGFTGREVFVNVAKFDLREHVSNASLNDLLSFSLWSQVADLSHGCEHYNVPDWGDKCWYVGYRGIDGCMHFYSDQARGKLKFPHFTNQETWDANAARGVEMICGYDRFFAFHVWHDIPRPDPKKAKVGHRF